MPEKDPSLMARCLECDSRIYFSRKPDLGEIIVCPECETSLEVIRTAPIRFGWPDEGSVRGAAPVPTDLDEFFRSFDNDNVEFREDDEEY